MANTAGSEEGEDEMAGGMTIIIVRKEALNGRVVKGRVQIGAGPAAVEAVTKEVIMKEAMVKEDMAGEQISVVIGAVDVMGGECLLIM